VFVTYAPTLLFVAVDCALSGDVAPSFFVGMMFSDFGMSNKDGTDHH